MDFPTVINWTSLFPLYGLLGGIFPFYSNSNRTSVSKQWRPWSDAAFCFLFSLFVYVPQKRLIWVKEHTSLRRETCDLFINRFLYSVYYDPRRIGQKLTYIKLVLCQYLGAILTINEPVRRYIITHSFIKGSISPNSSESRQVSALAGAHRFNRHSGTLN